MFYHPYHNKNCIMPEVVSGGFTMGSTALGGAIGALASNRELKNQKELMEIAKQNQIELWNLQNGYMSPKNQMQRFKEAGLNPDLIYGKMGDTSGTMPNVSTPQAPNFAQAVTQGALGASQINLQDSIAKKNASETKSIDAQTDFYLKTFDTRVNLLTQQYNLTGFQAEWTKNMADYVKQSFVLLNAQIEGQKNLNYRTAYEGLLAEKEYESYDNRLSSWMSEMKSRARLNNSSAYKIEKEARFFIETWQERLEHARLLNSNLRSQSALNYSMKSMYDAETAFLNEKTLYLPFEFIDEVSRGANVFETDDEGKFVTDEKGRFKPNKTYSGVKLGLEITGEVMDIAGDVVGMILPWKFLKNGFTVGGAKTAQNSLKSGHVPPTTGPVKGGMKTKYSSDYIKTYNEWMKAKKSGDVAKANKLYNKLLRME